MKKLWRQHKLILRMLFINKFIKEESWKKFISSYEKDFIERDNGGFKTSIVSDEEIWPLLKSIQPIQKILYFLCPYIIFLF